MYIFMIPHWEGFPISEYGGLHCVVARDEDEAIKILTQGAEGDYYYDSDPEGCSKSIQDVVKRADRLKLDPNVRLSSGIVCSFVT